MPTKLTVIPSARRLMESLRDIGYEPAAAVADLVDNSLDADAGAVDIRVEFEGATSWIRIADNGTGMTSVPLNEAMRYGSERDYAESALGKFGLGLKTASLSQCECLTVATRADPRRRHIEIRRWDLRHVREGNSWELLRLYTHEVRPELVEPLRERPGTVVMWERLDRILKYKLPSGRAAETGLQTLCREIEEHLAMVFHRFLAGQAERPLPFSISLNGNRISAWDPFAVREPATQRLERQDVRLRHEGRDLSIRVTPYILPSQGRFSSQRAWEIAAGPRKWNRQQGFYVYRGDRLIQSGGWNRLRTFDEHTKLARIAVDIPPAADSAFEVNVSKMRLLIPASIRNDLKAIASAVARRAQSAYRTGGAVAKPVRQTRMSGDGPPQRTRGPSGEIRDTACRNGVIAVSELQRILERELGAHPELLRRVLSALFLHAGEEEARRRGARA